MNNEHGETAQFIDGKKEYTCSLASLPVLELEEFTNLKLNPNYFFNVKKIGASILYVESHGDMSFSDVGLHYEMIDNFIAAANVKTPIIEIRDFSKLTGKSPHAEIKYQKNYLQSREDKFAGYILCNPPLWLNAIATVVFKSYKISPVLKIASDCDEAISFALAILENKRASVTDFLSLNDILFPSNWEYNNPLTGNRVVNGVIPGKLLFSSLHGNIQLSDTIGALKTLPEIFTQGHLEGTNYIRVADYSGLKKSSVSARKQYAKVLTETNKAYNCRPTATYICGASFIAKSSLQTFSTFSRQRFIFVDSVTEAFKKINKTVENETHTVEKDKIIFSIGQGEIDEINNLCAGLLWDEAATINNLISPDNPLYPLKETLSVVKQDILELRKNDQLQSKNLLSLFEAIQIGIIIIDIKTHKILFANSYAAYMTRSTPEEMIGNTCHNFICPSQKGHCLATDHGSMIENAELVLLRKDGSSCPVFKSIKPLEYMNRACLLETFVDITEIKDARSLLENNIIKQQNLMGELTNIKKAVDSTTDAIGISTAEGHHFYQNNTFTRMFGYEIDEFEAMHPSILYKDEKIGKKVFNIIMAGGDWRGETQMVAKSGYCFPVHIRANCVKNNQGKIVALIGVHTDITERKRSEEKLLTTNTQLEIAIGQAKTRATEAKTANIAKSEFLANMSHEIRTPMNGVIGMTRLLMDTDLDEKQRGYAQTLSNSGESLLILINDILDLSKIEAGKLEIEEIDFNIKNLLTDFAAAISYKTEEKGLELICSSEHAVPTFVKGDPGRLRQILTNLVGNSVKFTTTGEVVIYCRLEKALQHSHVLHFSVKDTGIGISKKNQSKLFKKFTQADGSTTRKFGGTGLGLAISKQLTQLMGGKIGVESEEGMGTTFWFTIEFGHSDNKEEPVRTNHDALKKAKILIIDDNKLNLNIIGSILSSWNIENALTTNGKEGLETLLAAHDKKVPFDVAIISLQMPIFDGAELGKAIKRNKKLSNTHLILVSSIGNRGDAAALKKVRFDAFLTKPVSQSILYDCLAQTMGISVSTDKKTNSRLITRHSINDDKQKKQSKRLLLVEDNNVNRMVAKAVVKKLGYNIDVAVDGREALKMLGKNRYDLVFMDIQMPVMDGLTATRNIRDKSSDVLDHEIAIVAMTANAMTGDREMCLEAGMNDYISKPINPDDVESTLNRLLFPDNSKNN